VKLLGITGGVGMGKSTAQSILASRSIPTIDTDELARALVEPGQPTLRDIESEFGREVLHLDGSLKRDVLAARVFGDADSRARLESILHPRIRAAWLKDVERWRQANVPIGAIVIPLLFETEGADDFDVLVCIACSAETQQVRLKPRGWSASEIEQRIASQWPIQKKMDLSDHVVWTEGDLRSHEQQWNRLLSSPGFLG
jgi:dephospho-CoA kinase